MKKIVFFVLIGVLFCVYGCGQSRISQPSPVVTADSTAYYKAKYQTAHYMAVNYGNYLVAYENRRVEMADSIRLLTDSVNKLNARPLMSKTQFLDLYKYERLLKYYKICKQRPVNWKYYKGWTIRVFEGGD